MKNLSLSRWILLAIMAVLFFFPLVIDSPYIMAVLVLACIYTVYVASWDLLSGFTGQENFGYALFIGAGAYIVGFITKFAGGIGPILGIPLGGLVAAIFGLTLGVPCLRLKGPYLALATMAAGTIADRASMMFSQYTGGEDGIYGIKPLFDVPATEFAMLSYYAALIFMVVCVGICYFIGKSDVGLILKAVKQDENAAEALGINTTYYKVGAFVVSAFFGGMAGSFNAHYLGYVGPDAMLASSISLNVIIMAIVGGTGTILSAAGGAFALTLVGEVLKEKTGDYHLLIYSALLVLTILFMPKGAFNSLGGFLKDLFAKPAKVAKGGGSSASHS